MLRRFAPACKSTILIRAKARSLMGSVIVGSDFENEFTHRRKLKCRL